MPARLDCITATASGVERACAAAKVPQKVNLSSPAFALVVEVVPAMCAKSAVVVGAFLSLLPVTMLVLRPKLAVRALNVA